MELLGRLDIVRPDRPANALPGRLEPPVSWLSEDVDIPELLELTKNISEETFRKAAQPQAQMRYLGDVKSGAEINARAAEATLDDLKVIWMDVLRALVDDLEVTPEDSDHKFFRAEVVEQNLEKHSKFRYVVAKISKLDYTFFAATIGEDEIKELVTKATNMIVSGSLEWLTQINDVPVLVTRADIEEVKQQTP